MRTLPATGLSAHVSYGETKVEPTDMAMCAPLCPVKPVCPVAPMPCPFSTESPTLTDVPPRL